MIDKKLFKIERENGLNEISYLIKMLNKESPIASANWTIVAQPYQFTAPSSYLLIYLDKPNSSYNDLKATPIDSTYVQLVPFYLNSSFIAKNFLNESYREYYNQLIDKIQSCFIRFGSDFESIYSITGRSILLITIYNCYGTEKDFYKLTASARVALQKHLYHNRNIRITGVSQEFPK